MKNNRSIKRRGFTLVELLIVIVVIGVLSAMMMLSSTEAVSSARASNIVSNLRNLKTAALAWYADHLDVVSGDFTLDDKDDYRTEILKYMNNDDIDAAYVFYGSATPETWYVCYDNTKGRKELSAKVSEKLAGRAKSVGLYKDKPTGQANANTYTAESSGGTQVYMFIR